MKMMASTFIDSGAFSGIKLADAMVRLQAGRELGLMPMESMKFIAVVGGRPSLWGEKAIELVISAGHTVEWGICNHETATVKITRRDNGQYMSNTFTMKQAIERGMHMGRDGIKPAWKNSPENMLKFKAFHMTAKFLVPDALRGASIAEIEESEGPGAQAAAVAVAASVGLSVNNESAKAKLKPLAERVAEQKKEVVMEGEIVHQTVHQPTVNAVENPPEPTYEPITPPEPPTPVIQVDSPLPPPKAGEGVAARKMREAADKAKAAKSSNDF